MKKLFLFSFMSLIGVSAFALPDYDPFADASGSGGTTYAVGANLIGQTDAQGNSWFQAGPTSATQPTIASGSLTIAGLAAPSGNSVAFGGNGESTRFAIGSTVSSGSIYFSFAMQLTSISSLNTSGVFWAGFNNTATTSTTTPSVVGAKLYTRAATGGFNIGISKSSTTGTDIAWDSTDVFNTSSVVFLVGSYTYNTSSGSDDVAQLWVNPSSTTFGGTAPTATLTDANNTDLGANIASFVLADRSANEPNSGLIDELRIGTSYAGVTPGAVPEPTTIALTGLGAVTMGLYLRRRFRRK